MTKRNAKSIKLPRSIRRMFPNVTHAVDANAAVEISVNRHDCKIGTKLNPTECALAKAAKREFKADGAIIGLSSSYIIKGNKAVRFATPESVQREIVSFDRHQDFSPGDYRLVPKAKSVQFGVNKHKTGGRNKNATRKIHHSARVRVLPMGQGE